MCGIHVGERVVAEIMALLIDALDERAVSRARGANDEEGRKHTLLPENIQDLRSVLGVGPVIEGEGDYLVFASPPSRDDRAFRVGLDLLAGDEIGKRIEDNFARTGLRLATDAENFPFAPGEHI